MSYRALPLECHCGEIPERILEVGFTSDRHVVIHYWCSSCKRVLYVSRTIEECGELCPEAEVEPAQIVPEEAAAHDAQFLQSMGIISGE
jgi:hypothetical protein